MGGKKGSFSTFLEGSKGYGELVFFGSYPVLVEGFEHGWTWGAHLFLDFWRRNQIGSLSFWRYPVFGWLGFKGKLKIYGGVTEKRQAHTGC